MKGKKRRSVLKMRTAAILVAVLFVGLIAGANVLYGMNDQLFADSSNQWNPAVDTTDNGEVIPDQYIVKLDNGDVQLVDEKKLNKLEKQGKVAAAEQNRIVTAFDTEQKAIVDAGSRELAQMQYGDELVRSTEAWEMLPNEEDMATVRVAVIDTGIDATHPDLKGRVIDGATIIAETEAGNGYANDGKDDNGHGTHVAGIIAAVWNNNLGIDGVTGRADIELMPVKVLNDAGRGTTYDIIAGIRYAADHGASILNLSLGSSASSELEAEAVRYAQNKGCLVIAAAGNDAVNVASAWPASYEGVISVGSVDSLGEKSYFSNYGESLDVAAPGSDIISTIPKTIALQQAAQGETVYGNDEDGYYISWSGTSMATPHAVGVAALYKAVNPGMSGWDIGDMLVRTCRDVGDVGKDVETGAGIVDAAAMLGAEVIKTPLKIKSPTKGTELYEKVLLSAQVNPSMGIKTVKFYLDQQTKDALIGQAQCDKENYYYEIPWDTKTASDGEHQVLAAVFDENDKQIGETQSVKISILNSITNGFTIQVLNPEGGDAEKASYYIYGKQKDNSYTMIKSGSTSELGYSRVKGLSSNYSEYLMVVNGRFQTKLGAAGQYLYKKEIGLKDLGTTFTIDGSDVRKVEYQTKDAHGKALTNHYLRLGIQNGDGWLNDLSPFVMNSDTQLYLSDGVYRAEVCQSKDEKGCAYLLDGQWEITMMNPVANITIDGASKITARYARGVTGELKITGKNPQDRIPFLSGVIWGSEIYVSPGHEYIPSAELTAKLDGEDWRITVEKQSDDSVKPDGKPIEIEFTPNIVVNNFQLEGLQKDGEDAYMYVGDVLTSKNVFGDESGNIIRQAAQIYPTFRIYKVEDGKRQLIYEKTERGNKDSCYWNSKKNYNGEVPPGAGQYVAQLSYDAGPFGGKSVMEENFQMRTKSGRDEMTSAITMDGSYKMSRATMELYTWNGDERKWVQANTVNYGEADEQGIFRSILKDSIELDPSGIHIAVLQFKERTKGYQLPEDYIGFAVVPFKDIDDLQVMDVSSKDMKRMPVTVKDRYGNNKASKLSLPLMSDGGKLAQPEIVKDITFDVSSRSTERIYIPNGTYDYVYSRFNDSTSNYFLTGEGFKTSDTEKIALNGEDACELKVNVASRFEKSKVQIRTKNAKDSSSISMAVGNTIFITPGDYHLGLETYDANNQRYAIEKENLLKLSKNTQWDVGDAFVPEIKLKQKTVATDQSLLGQMSFRDGKGNLLTGMEIYKDGFYEAVYPMVHVGAMNVGKQSFSLTKEDGYHSFAIDPMYYYGEGSHYVFIGYDLGNGYRESAKMPFVVGLDYEPRIAPVKANGFSVEQKNDNEVVFVASSSTTGYLPISIEMNTSSRTRKVTFTHVRNEKTIQTVTMDAIFAAKANNTLDVSFNIKPGDKVYVTAK